MLKVIVCMLICCMVLPIGLNASAATNSVVMKIGDYVAVENLTQPIFIDTMAVVFPYKDGDAVMCPVRFTAEKLGATVSWDANEGAVNISKGSLNIKLKINSNVAEINGIANNMTKEVFLVARRTFIEGKNLCEMLGVKYELLQEQFILMGDISDKKSAMESYLKLKNDTLGNETKLIFEDLFQSQTQQNWVIETDGQGDETSVVFGDGIIDAQSSKGLTIWNKNKFSGNIRIEYTAKVIMEGGKNDRLSDMNCFWNASDPASPDNFFENSKKRGMFVTYDPLKLYYTGYGGNKNTSTRFRKYDGERKDILGEYLTQPYLLEQNMAYHIKIEVYKGYIRYYRDNVPIFSYHDKNFFSNGYFGFRSALNHLQYSNFKVYEFIEEV